jgi:hypothetical protein
VDPLIVNRDPWDPGLLGDPVRHKGLYRGTGLPGR